MIVGGGLATLIILIVVISVALGYGEKKVDPDEPDGPGPEPGPVHFDNNPYVYDFAKMKLEGSKVSGMLLYKNKNV